MPHLRFQPPERLPGAAEFSKDDALRGSLKAVRLVKSQRWVWNELRESCARLESDYARKREKGHWELVAIAFVASKHVDIQPWWDETTDELWRECGFESRPPYIRAWKRLRELETVCDEFLSAAGKVIRRCRAHDERVLAHVHFDSTEDETHAALIHDCEAGEECTRRVIKTRSGRKRASAGGALRPERVQTSVARREREAWNAADPEEAVKHERGVTPKHTEIIQRDGKLIKRIQLKDGCWYRTRDTGAGIRSYDGPRKAKRFWHGYYGSKAVCHLTGGVVPGVDDASTQEFDLFHDIYDRTTRMAGKKPETVIGDKGFSVAKCFKHATENGSAPIFPFRPSGGDRTRHDHETHDRHGVMRCKACGGPMNQTRFSANGGKPRLWFLCALDVTPECKKEQSISCSKDWKALVPLARTEALYFELRESHKTYEGAHDYWRDRYRVAADTLGVRPKVVGIDWHRLRAYTACLIDWLRIASKQGWLGSTRTKRRHGERRFKETGQRIAKRVAEMRVRYGLAQPYGSKAAALGIGEETPPSRRPRGAPPPVPAT